MAGCQGRESPLDLQSTLFELTGIPHWDPLNSVPRVLPMNNTYLSTRKSARLAACSLMGEKEREAQPVSATITSRPGLQSGLADRRSLPSFGSNSYDSRVDGRSGSVRATDRSRYGWVHPHQLFSSVLGVAQRTFRGRLGQGRRMVSQSELYDSLEMYAKTAIRIEQFHRFLTLCRAMSMRSAPKPLATQRR